MKFASETGSELNCLARARNPDSTSFIKMQAGQIEYPRNQAAETQLLATDSCCSTWFGKLSVNGESKVANLISGVNRCTALGTVTKAG
jgi:hypothetical protein